MDIKSLNAYGLLEEDWFVFFTVFVNMHIKDRCRLHRPIRLREKSRAGEKICCRPMRLHNDTYDRSSHSTTMSKCYRVVHYYVHHL